MFERTRVCLGGLVWKQKRFGQLRKRRAVEYQNRVFSVEDELKHPYANFVQAQKDTTLANFDINNASHQTEVMDRINKALCSSLNSCVTLFPRKQ